MRKFVVFYAWQSDTLQKHNRFLIRTALESAAHRISSDRALETEVHIDSDTQGILGQPPITDTILKKIDDCDVFAPDLTFVAATAGGKHVPNPNVMIEYGYALRAKKHSAMMSIMNTAYGPPEELPFDMKHLRHPTRYDLSEGATNAERRATRDDLSDKLENILRQMIAATPVKQKEGTPFAKSTPVRPPAFFFQANEVLAEQGLYESEKQRYRFDSDKAVFLRLYPAYADGQPAVGRAKVKTIFDARKPWAMADTFNGLVDHNNHGSIIFDPNGISAIFGLTQGFPTGELWGLNSQIFGIDRRPIYGREADPRAFLPMIGVEKLFVRVLDSYVRIAVQEYQLHPPFVVVAGGTGLLGVYAHVPSAEFGLGEFVGPFKSSSLEKPYLLEDVHQNNISDVLRRFFDEFYDLAACSRSAVLTDAHVTANKVPSRTPL